MAQESKPAGDTKDSSTGLVEAIIKKEKFDPEVEKKIQELKVGKKSTAGQTDEKKLKKSGDESQSSEDEEEDSSGEDTDADDDEEEDEKKNIEPVKSSNEILEELFKVFNAKPPEELLDDKNLIEKTLKRKKDKKKKHKRSKSGDDHSDSESDAKEEGEEGRSSPSGDKKKHKKKKKHKHKHKDGEKSKSKKKSKDADKEKIRIKEEDKLTTSGDRKKSKDRDKHNGDKLKDTSNKHHSHHSTDDKHHRRDSLEKRTSSSSAADHKRHHDKDHHEDSHKRRKTDDKVNPFYSSSSKDLKHYDKDKSETIKIKTEPVDKGTSSSSKRHEDGEISEISLSDEEDYLEERRDNKYKSHNSFYAGAKRSRSRDNERHYTKERFRDRTGREGDRDGGGSYRRGGRNYSHRSRSRSRSRDLGIDKKRLLEIARKNAISMFKRGNLPGCANMTEDVKDKVLLKMRYGGRTVEDLTEFCKKISNGEHLSELSSDEGSDIDKSGNAKAFHHPFQIKEREPIVMHIRNSKPIVPAPAKTEEQTKTITMQFPVSSGQQHRMTEAWIPVEPKEKLPPLPVLPAATQSTSIFKSSVAKNALGKPLPKESEQEPAFKPVDNTGAATNVTTTQSTSTTSPEMPPAVTTVPTSIVPAPQNVACIPPPVPPPYFYGQPPQQTMHGGMPVPPTLPVPPPGMPAIPPQMLTQPAPTSFTPDVPVPSSTSNPASISVFPEPPSQPMDVSAIISKRLNAMRRLQENPMDSEAIKMMYNSQKEMTTWAASKHLPGQFTGSTGVNVLKPNQLHSGPQHWARRDQLTSTKPVTGGMGMHLLQKMGWKPGEGLGREKNGSLQPLLLDVKLDKRGLVAQEDIRPTKSKKGGGGGVVQRNNGPAAANQRLPENPQNKHPVCLLNEITTKNKWTPPLYTVVQESGPPHSRMFLFSVQVNDKTFTPSKLCNNKKEAKFQAAKLCLQEMGILPPD
ncbi:protein Son [Musca vetustissima]|uniref:protein Son n=1 Tax=Musca vetustissima TaxID=27455 RepID=UPI002AB671F2|nr:protein Son [Musca vetustissima]